MAKPYRRYVKEIHSALHYGATWTPGTPLRLGQIGTFEDGVFIPKGHLDAVGINFTVEQDTDPTAYTYLSANGASLRFKAKGEPAGAFASLTDADAGAAVTFTREHAVLFSASLCYEHRIANVLALEVDLALRLNRGMWKEDWAVVTHLLQATTGTIVISGASNTKVELEANATAGQGPTKIADLSAGVSLAYSDSMAQLIIAQTGLTPLFHTIRLKRSFWNGIPTAVLNKRALTSGKVAREGSTVGASSFEIVDYDPDSMEKPDESPTED